MSCHHILMTIGKPCKASNIKKEKRKRKSKVKQFLLLQAAGPSGWVGAMSTVGRVVESWSCDGAKFGATFRLLVISRSTNSTWESISCTSSLMLGVSSSSSMPVGFWTGGWGSRMGICPRFLNGELTDTSSLAEQPSILHWTHVVVTSRWLVPRSSWHLWSLHCITCSYKLLGSLLALQFRWPVPNLDFLL